jgi:hypothetical protein
MGEESTDAWVFSTFRELTLVSYWSPVIYFERAGPKCRRVLWKVLGAPEIRALNSLPKLTPADWSGMQKRRILIVDNNDELRAILEHALGSLGCEAVVTGDREEALGRDDLDEFDLIISDLTEDDSGPESSGASGPGPTAESNGKLPANSLPQR